MLLHAMFEFAQPPRNELRRPKRCRLPLRTGIFSDEPYLHTTLVVSLLHQRRSRNGGLSPRGCCDRTIFESQSAFPSAPAASNKNQNQPNVIFRGLRYNELTKFTMTLSFLFTKLLKVALVSWTTCPPSPDLRGTNMALGAIEDVRSNFRIHRLKHCLWRQGPRSEDLSTRQPPLPTSHEWERRSTTGLSMLGAKWGAMFLRVLLCMEWTKRKVRQISKLCHNPSPLSPMAASTRVALQSTSELFGLKEGIPGKHTPMSYACSTIHKFYFMQLELGVAAT